MSSFSANTSSGTKLKLYAAARDPDSLADVFALDPDRVHR